MSHFTNYELSIDILYERKDIRKLKEIEKAFEEGTIFTHHLFGEKKGQAREGEDCLDVSLDAITSMGINYDILHIHFSAYGYDMPDFAQYIRNNNQQWSVVALEEKWVEI